MKGKIRLAVAEIRALGLVLALRRVIRYILSYVLSKVLRPWNKTFILSGNAHSFKVTQRSFDNERSVEVPVTLSFIENHPSSRLLEIGNVLHCYIKSSHDVVDKYERAPGVINQDVVEFAPLAKYDVIVSISTIEHVGLDEPLKERGKCVRALLHIKSLLEDGGKALITVPVGYNEDIDTYIINNRASFENITFLKRVSLSNKWIEVDMEEAMQHRYGCRFPAANAVAFLYLNK